MDSKKGTPIRLLARLADHECADKLNITPLHIAALNGSLQDAKNLLHNGNAHATDKSGWTPLHDAAIQGHAEIVTLLIDAGADVNAQDTEDHYTPLHDAARMNHANIVKLLLAAGADRSLKDKYGDTPLDIAQEYDLQDVVDILS